MLKRCRVLTIAVLAILAVNCSQAPSDYDMELQRIEAELRALDTATDTESPLTRELQRIQQLYAYASLTADYGDFKAAELAINTAIEQYGELYDLIVFRARLNLKVHRLSASRRDLERLSGFDDNPEVTAMLADIALQEGRYADSLESYQALVKAFPKWDKQARLAWYLSKTGHTDKADTLYHDAQETLSYQQMRPYAWLELQRGILDLDQHRYEQALAHFQHADRAWSGYWLIREHLAEAYQLTGDTRSARNIYSDIVAQHQHPEYFFALAQLEQSRDPELAESLREQAAALFEKRNRLYPEAAKGHYVEFLLALQHQESDKKLLELAEQNCTDRPYAESQLLLAKAYLKLDQPDAARDVMADILRSPWRSQEITTLAETLNVGAVNELHTSMN